MILVEPPGAASHMRLICSSLSSMLASFNAVSGFDGSDNLAARSQEHAVILKIFDLLIRQRHRLGLRLCGLRGGVECIHAFLKLKGRWLGYVSERDTTFCFPNLQSRHRLPLYWLVCFA